MKISFYRKNAKAKETVIFAQICWKGNVLKYTFGLTGNTKEWSIKRQRFKNDTERNSVIESQIQLIEKIYFSHLSRTKEAPSRTLLKQLMDKATTSMDFIEYTDLFIQQKSEILSVATIRKKKSTIKKFKAFCRKEYFTFEDINLSWLDRFEKFLSQKGYALNTMAKDVSILREILHAAKDDGYNENLSFMSRRFSLKKEEVINVYLSEIEIELILKAELKPRLDRARDIFLIGCYTGLRFSDFSRLTDKVFRNIDGKFCLVMKQQKVKQQVVIPVHYVVENILKKHNGWPAFISNQKLNEYIKEVCKIAGITENITISKTVQNKLQSKNYKKFELITTHTARRSFSTNAYKAGVPVFAIMSITGHRTQKNFMKYIKVTNEENAVILANHSFFEPKLKIVK